MTGVPIGPAIVLRGVALICLATWSFGCGAADTRRNVQPEGRDGASPRVTHTLDVGAAPHGIRFSEDGDTAYVALSGDGQVAVIDVPAMEVVGRFEAGSTPLDLVRTGDHWTITQFQDSTLIRRAGLGSTPGGADGSERSPQSVGRGPSLFTPNPVDGRAWVTSEFADRMTEIDLATGGVMRTFSTGARPYPADVVRDGSIAFVPSLTDGTVAVIDLLEGSTISEVTVCDAPPGGALTADQVSYLVACGGTDELVFLNTASFEVTARIDGLGPRPFSVEVTPDGRFAVVNNAGGSTVSIVDVPQRRLVTNLDVGDQPIVVRVHPDGRRIFVANELSGTISVVHLPPAPRVEREDVPNEVVVLGMIHGEHRTSDAFSTEVLEALIRAIDPDYVLVEIPPNRFDAATAGFAADAHISEPRVLRFPEYVDVLFPLTGEMDFEIVPTAGWNLQMSDYRTRRLDEISRDPEWADEWAEYEDAGARSEAALAAGGAADDPRWIHTDAYDAAQDLRLSVYDRLFNDHIGPGGWTQINEAHYGHIADALDAHSGEGARVLITYGAGHKVWFMRELRKRTDIRLLEVGPFLDAIGR